MVLMVLRTFEGPYFAPAMAAGGGREKRLRIEAHTTQHDETQSQQTPGEKRSREHAGIGSGSGLGLGAPQETDNGEGGKRTRGHQEYSREGWPEKGEG